MATTQGIMRETAFQTGDAAKYSNTLAGAQAALKAQTKMLSSALGSMFAPALQQCIPQVTALLERLTALAEKPGKSWRYYSARRVQRVGHRQTPPSLPIAHGKCPQTSAVRRKRRRIIKTLCSASMKSIVSERRIPDLIAAAEAEAAQRYRAEETILRAHFQC